MSSVCEQSVQAAFKLANVALHLLGDERQHFAGYRADDRTLQLGTQNGDAGLVLGRLDIGGQPPLEARAQPILENRDGFWRPIAGEHDLTTSLVDGVERVEKLFLGALFA